MNIDPKYWLQAILAIGAGSMAVNAVKGLLGGDDKAHAEEVDKHAKKASSSSSGSDDSISKALESLRKSGQQITVDCLASASIGWTA